MPETNNGAVPAGPAPLSFIRKGRNPLGDGGRARLHLPMRITPAGRTKEDFSLANAQYFSAPEFAQSILRKDVNAAMWPFKKTQLAGPEEFPAVIDRLIERLRSAGFIEDADRLHHVVHEFVATTSNEFYGELSLALMMTARKRRALPPDIHAEVRRLAKSIGRICRWR